MTDPNTENKLQDGASGTVVDIGEATAEVAVDGILEVVVESVSGVAGEIIGGVLDGI